MNAWAVNWMRLTGSTDPHRDTPIVMNCWTGLVLHQLANPDPAFDPLTPLLTLITTLVSSPARRSAS